MDGAGTVRGHLKNNFPAALAHKVIHKNALRAAIIFECHPLVILARHTHPVLRSRMKPTYDRISAAVLIPLCKADMRSQLHAPPLTTLKSCKFIRKPVILLYAFLRKRGITVCRLSALRGVMSALSGIEMQLEQVCGGCCRKADHAVIAVPLRLG